MQIVTFGTKEYQWLAPPFAALVKKYWGEGRILWFGNEQSDPMPDNVEFQVVPGWDWYKNFENGFGDGLITVLRSLSDPVILMVLPDMWPISSIPLDLIEILESYILTHPNVLRIGLQWDINQFHHGKPLYGYHLETWRGIDFYTVDIRDRDAGLYGGCLLHPSLWNRELALSLFVASTIWDWEIKNTAQMVDTPYLSVWTNRPIYRQAHVHFRANPGLLDLSWVDDCQDKELIASLLPKHTWLHDGKFILVDDFHIQAIEQPGQQQSLLPCVKDEDSESCIRMRYFGRNTRTFTIFGPVSHTTYTVQGHGWCFSVQPEDAVFIEEMGRGKYFRRIE